MSDSSLRVFFLDTKFLLVKLRDFLDVVDESLNFEENRVWQHSDEVLRQSFYWEVKAFEFEYLWPLAKHYSFVTLLHLTIEERLRQLCLIVQTHDEKLSIHPLGNGIESYMNFLEGSERYNIRRKELMNWQAITDFEKVRNCLVHAFGRIEYVRAKDKKRLQHLIKMDKGLSVETRVPQSSQLMPSFDYCRNAVGTALKFFLEIDEQLSQ